MWAGIINISHMTIEHAIGKMNKLKLDSIIIATGGNIAKHNPFQGIWVAIFFYYYLFGGTT